MSTPPPERPQWQHRRARHLTVADIDADYEARRKRARTFDRACGLFGLAAAVYFLGQMLRPWLSTF